MCRQLKWTLEDGKNQHIAILGRAVDVVFESVCIRIFVTIVRVTVSRLRHRPTRHAFIITEQQRTNAHSKTFKNLTRDSLDTGTLSTR